MTVSSEGVLELQGNYHDAVQLSAVDTCGSGTTATRGIYANLDAAYHDVDLGQTTGAPFGFVNAGDTFDVDVRVQGSNSFDVTAFQIVLTFDSSVVQVSSDSDCAQGSDWSSSFECTTNDPVNEVLVVGSCGLSPSSGCGSKGLLTVATVTFTAVGGGSTDISGEIVKIKDDSTTTMDKDIVAGTDQLVVVGGRRLTSGKRDMAVTHRRRGQQRSRRRTDSDECDGMVLGDTNGDCAFDVEDVQQLQYYIGDPSGYVLNAQQQQAVDPDLDGDSDGMDIDYLMKALAISTGVPLQFRVVGTSVLAVVDGPHVVVGARVVDADLGAVRDRHGTQRCDHDGIRARHGCCGHGGRYSGDWRDECIVAGRICSPSSERAPFRGVSWLGDSDPH